MIHEAKKIEKEIFSSLEGDYFSKNNGPISKLRNLMNSVLDSDINRKIHKPSITGVVRYGGKTEPKCDILVETKLGTIYKFSIKKDESAYIHTSNSYLDSKILLLELPFSKYLSEKEIKSIDTCIKSNLIKIPNFSSWDRSKGGYVEYVEYHLSKIEKNIINWVGLEKFNLIKSKIIERYDLESKSKYNSYLSELNFRESEVQSIWRMIVDNEPYAKSLIYEMCTGNYKFGENSESSANYIVSDSGVYKLDSENCEYVEKKLSQFRKMKKVGRLQNVPRVGLSRSVLMSDDINFIVNSFPTADLSMKL